jgi:hypothetical protein
MGIIFMRKTMFVRTFSIFFVALFMLSACGQFEVANEEVSKNERKAEKAISTIAPSSREKTPLRVDNRPWPTDRPYHQM